MIFQNESFFQKDFYGEIVWTIKYNTILEYIEQEINPITRNKKAPLNKGAFSGEYRGRTDDLPDASGRSFN